MMTATATADRVTITRTFQHPDTCALIRLHYRESHGEHCVSRESLDGEGETETWRFDEIHHARHAWDRLKARLLAAGFLAVRGR